jgi:uncharacterized protein
MNNCFRIDGDKIRLEIKAVPGASKTEFAGVKDGRLRVRLSAVAEDGKANVELISFLSKRIGCAKRDLRIVNGEKTRVKVIEVPIGCKAKLEEII